MYAPCCMRFKKSSLLDNVSRTKTISANSCRDNYSWREFQIDAAMLANSPTYIVRLFSAITIQIRYVVLEIFELAGYGPKFKAQKSDPEGFKLYLVQLLAIPMVCSHNNP